MNQSAKVIKVYQNGKLYDTQNHCYVKLSDVAKMIRNDENIQVIDNKSKTDVTVQTLTAIIMDNEKRASYSSSNKILLDIIKSDSLSIQTYLTAKGVL